MRYQFIVLAAVGVTLGCAHEVKNEPKLKDPSAAAVANGVPSIEAKQVAAEEQAAFVAEIKFAKNHHRLDQASRIRVKKLIDQAKKDGRITRTQIVVWADQEYPSVHTKALSSDQVKLVQRRSDELTTIVKSFDKNIEPEVHNMAERPGMWGELVSNAGARLKKAFEVAGIPNTDTSVKTPSKASHAVLLISVEEPKSQEAKTNGESTKIN